MKWTTHDSLAVIEAVYADDYYRYYGEHFGWEEITERIVPEEVEVTYDENGNPRIDCGGGAYLRTTWRPREEREEGRRPEKRLSGRPRKLLRSVQTT